MNLSFDINLIANSLKELTYFKSAKELKHSKFSLFFVSHLFKHLEKSIGSILKNLDQGYPVEQSQIAYSYCTSVPLTQQTVHLELTLATAI